MKLRLVASALLIIILAASAITEAAAQPWHGRRGWHGPRPGYGRAHVRIAPPIFVPPVVMPPVVQYGYVRRPYVRPYCPPPRYYNHGYAYGRGYNRYDDRGYRGGHGRHYRRY